MTTFAVLCLTLPVSVITTLFGRASGVFFWEGRNENELENDRVLDGAVVITRIFGIVVKENKTDGLVPYADMLNHSTRERDGVEV